MLFKGMFHEHIARSGQENLRLLGIVRSIRCLATYLSGAGPTVMTLLNDQAEALKRLSMVLV